MGKLYFNYSTMNAGKSTALLQAAYNYEERGMAVLLLTAACDDRSGRGRIASRVGLARNAEVFDASTDLYERVRTARGDEDADNTAILGADSDANISANRNANRCPNTHAHSSTH